MQSNLLHTSFFRQDVLGESKIRTGIRLVHALSSEGNLTAKAKTITAASKPYLDVQGFLYISIGLNRGSLCFCFLDTLILVACDLRYSKSSHKVMTS